MVALCGLNWGKKNKFPTVEEFSLLVKGSLAPFCIELHFRLQAGNNQPMIKEDYHRKISGMG